MRKQTILNATIAGVVAIGIGAIATIEHRHAAPLQETTFSLLADYPDGNEYVIDYGLTAEDCAFYAKASAAKHPQTEFLCQSGKPSARAMSLDAQRAAYGEH